MSNQKGFTIVEVLVAVMVLAVGVIALVGSSATITRMIGRGRHDTRAALVAESRLEILRQQARSTTPLCTGLANGTATTQGMAESWSIAASGTTRTLTSQVIYRVAGRTDTLQLLTIIRCT